MIIFHPKIKNKNCFLINLYINVIIHKKLLIMRAIHKNIIFVLHLIKLSYTNIDKIDELSIRDEKKICATIEIVIKIKGMKK